MEFIVEVLIYCTVALLIAIMVIVFMLFPKKYVGSSNAVSYSSIQYVECSYF